MSYKVDLSRAVIRAEPSRSTNKRVRVRVFLNEPSRSNMLNEPNFVIELDSVTIRVESSILVSYTSRVFGEPGRVPV